MVRVGRRREPRRRPQEPPQCSHCGSCPHQGWEGAGGWGGNETSREVGVRRFDAVRERPLQTCGPGYSVAGLQLGRPGVSDREILGKGAEPGYSSAPH